MKVSSIVSFASQGELAALSRGRDNNLNFVRFAAAVAVVYAHSFGVTGHASEEPIHRIFGLGAGDAAVDVFFVIRNLAYWEA
jgi:peptidoglycan/LPS O-acetylase OafA/YrhL